MMSLFYMGGTFFMSILTLILLSIVVVSILNALRIRLSKEVSDFQLNSIKSMGLFAMVFGMLGQLIAIFSAFEYIEEAGGISQAILAGGLKVSSITTIYGIIIFLISYLIWLAESAWYNSLHD